MPYTLMKGLGWFLLALFLGMVIGWILRSVAATRQMRRLRAVRADHSELDRLRARNANLEPLVAERDRLTADLAAAQHTAGAAAVVEPAPPDSADIAVAEAEIEAIAEADDPGAVGADTTPEPEFTELNLVAAAAVIGTKVKLDDLTVVRGLGPDVAQLCNGIGIHTWADLATTEVSLLRTMLSEAGVLDTNDPSTWPQQAGHLAAGDWEAFTAMNDSTDGGSAAG